MPIDPSDYDAPDVWQPIKDIEGCRTYKMAVKGGWLYRTIANAQGSHPSMAVVFVADPTRQR